VQVEYAPDEVAQMVDGSQNARFESLLAFDPSHGMPFEWTKRFSFFYAHNSKHEDDHSHMLLLLHMSEACLLSG